VSVTIDLHAWRPTEAQGSAGHSSSTDKACSPVLSPGEKLGRLGIIIRTYTNGYISPF